MERLGIIGKPSDWLIASQVNYQNVKDLFDIELIDIDINELISLANSSTSLALNQEFENLNYNKNELKKAYAIYVALLKIVEKYQLKGLTVRCFDLLNTLHSTSCLAFAFLNRDNIIATCEGDIPSLITMYLINKITNKSSFQANPAKINLKDNEIIFAHCTLPLSMCESFTLTSHFESKIGVAIKGKLKNSKVSILKFNSDFTKLVFLKGTIIKNLNSNKLCRTQILIKNDNQYDLNYFLTKPLGNHHIIVYEDIESKLLTYLRQNKKCKILEILGFKGVFR